MKKSDVVDLIDISGAGKVIYKAVHFPFYMYANEEPNLNKGNNIINNREAKSEIIKENNDYVLIPVVSNHEGLRPKYTDTHKITDSIILTSLLNLYDDINSLGNGIDPYVEIQKWVTQYMQPYAIDELADMFKDSIETKIPIPFYEIEKIAKFNPDRFINDLVRLGSVIEPFFVLKELLLYENVDKFKQAIHEGRHRDFCEMFEKYKYLENKKCLEEIKNDKNELMDKIIDSCPDFNNFRLLRDTKTNEVFMKAKVESVFQIAWCSFASILCRNSIITNEEVDMDIKLKKCPYCNEWFIPKSNRQIYCGKQECEHARLRKNRNNSYDRHKNDKKLDKSKNKK